MKPFDDIPLSSLSDSFHLYGDKHGVAICLPLQQGVIWIDTSKTNCEEALDIVNLLNVQIKDTLLSETEYAIKNLKAATGKSYVDCIAEVRRVIGELELACKHKKKLNSYTQVDVKKL